jgi:hypothetical protein
MILMGILGGIVGFGTSSLFVLGINTLGFSLYNRNGLDIKTKEYLGTTNWDDIMVDDLFIVAYSYNAEEPRFYSKWFIKNDPGIYSVDIATAVASSSSAPLYF